MSINYKFSFKRALLFLSAWMSITHPVKAQLWPDYIIQDKNYSGGRYTFCSDGYITSPGSPSHPVTYNGTSDVEYNAAKYIELLPGFTAGPYSAGGKFKTQFYTPGFPVVVIAPTTPGIVGQYEKLEYGLDLPAVVDNLVADYFANNSTGVNPFAPEDISINASFTSPSGTQDRNIHGFYYKDFTISQSPDYWNESPTDYPFRVRFAPTELGLWHCEIKVSSPNNKFATFIGDACLNFMCVPSANKGYLEVGQDGRHLRFSKTHESFFAIGQNIPWIDRTGDDDNNTFKASWFANFRNELINLGTNQGNFVRFLMNAGGHGIEWEKLGDYSSCNTYVDGQHSAGTVTVAMQDRQHNAYEVDKVFETCLQKGIYVDLNVEMHSGYVEYNTSIDPNQMYFYSWNNNQQKMAFGLSSPVQALSNADAKKYFKRRLRYIIARWGYSTNLAVIELLSEQDGWTGFSPSVRADSYDWHHEMASYIKTSLGDHNHLISTSYGVKPGGATPPINNFNVPEIDVTSAHKYGSNRDVNIADRYEIMHIPYGVGTSNTQGLYVDIHKPTIFGELGMGGQTPCQSCPSNTYVAVETIEGCSDVSFHNAMWATALMGCYGTGLNWWQADNNAYRSQNYPALRSFFNSIDFESNNFTLCLPPWADLTIPENDHKFEVFTMRDLTGSKLIGWAHNATYWWGNSPAFCADSDLRIADPNAFSDNDAAVLPQTYASRKVILSAPLIFPLRYDVEWFHTRGAGGSYGVVTKYVNLLGQLKLYYPGTEADYAFHATRQGVSFRTTDDELPPLSDTLLCYEDTIMVDATLPEDTGHVYSYHWNFGNGQTSSVPTATVIYTAPGSYSASLVVTYSPGKADTLKQVIVVPDCDGLSRVAGVKNSSPAEDQSSIRISPNPNSGVFTLTTSGEDEKQILIYNVMGKVVYEKEYITDKVISINISDQTKGIYFVKVISGNVVQTEKIINQ